ncbi:MAG: methionine transporter substrate-binding protein, partial [Polaromonas sp.]|nr:methionine transporter substrate-binding protein [Polaromonas sp.]
MKKLLIALLLGSSLLAHAADKLVVGASPTPHAELLEHLKPMLARDGVELDIKVYTDYVQ